MEFHAGIAQLARASAFQAEGRGFESRFPLHTLNFLECLQRVARLGVGRSHLAMKRDGLGNVIATPLNAGYPSEWDF